MKVVVIIQAHMASTRLPGKVMKDIAGEPMLAHVVARASRAHNIDNVVVATTDQSGDEAIVNLCRTKGWDYFRGSEDDVLDRYFRAATAFGADVVVRITSDCPLVEAEIIDRAIHEFLSAYPGVDYVSNTVKRTFPMGLDTEVIGMAALERAWREDDDPGRREHVTPYIWSQPEKFRIRNITGDADYSAMRWTVDTSEDLTFVRQIYDHFQDDTFRWREVIELLKVHPEWQEINRHIPQKPVP